MNTKLGGLKKCRELKGLRSSDLVTTKSSHNKSIIPPEVNDLKRTGLIKTIDGSKVDSFQVGVAFYQAVFKVSPFTTASLSNSGYQTFCNFQKFKNQMQKLQRQLSLKLSDQI